MIDGGKKGMNAYWWTPLEPLVKEKKWTELLTLIEKFRIEKLNGEKYDEATVNKQ